MNHEQKNEQMIRTRLKKKDENIINVSEHCSM